MPSSSRKSTGKKPTSARGGNYSGGAGQGGGGDGDEDEDRNDDDDALAGRKRAKIELHRDSSSVPRGGGRTAPDRGLAAGIASTGGSPRGTAPTYVGGKKGGAGAGGAATPCSEAAGPRETIKSKGKAPRRRRKKAPWGGKDWAGQPLSQAVKEDLLEEVTLWTVSEEGTLLGEDGNHFFCR